MPEKPKLTLIRDGWEEFRDAVLPKDVPPEAVRVVRTAFYAGCVMMMTLIHQIDSSDDNDKSVGMLNSMIAELNDYVMDGREEAEEFRVSVRDEIRRRLEDERVVLKRPPHGGLLN